MFESIGLPEALIKEINENSQKQKFPKNTNLISIGDQMVHIPFVLNGSIRVYTENEDTGKEVLLYYVEKGETCLMSMIASFKNKVSKVSASTEKDSEIVLISNEKVHEWQMKFSEWNDLIINLFVNRYDDLLQTIEEISFKKIDDRLKTYLNKHLNDSGEISISKTHKQIANDLGTSREVISRTLKKIEVNMDTDFILKKS